MTSSGVDFRGPPGLGFDHLKRMQADLLGHLVSMQREHGDAVKYRLLAFQMYQITDPDLAHEILGPKNRSFVKPARLRRVLGQWNGNGLLLNEGEGWARQRRRIGPTFRPQQVDGYVERFTRNAEAMVASWKGRDRVDVARALMRLTLRSVTEALFSEEVASHEDRIIEAVAELNEAAIRELTAPVVWPMRWPSPRKRRLRRAVETLTTVVDGFIAKRRASPGDDLLSKMLVAIDEEGDRTHMTDRQARDESINLMLGGNETTATALVWTLYLLARHPDLQEEVAAEARAHAGDIEKMTLARHAFSEAMRLYPPAYILSRQVAEDVEIGGERMRRGAQVHVVPFVIHRDPRWYETPDAFIPRRFERASDLPPCAYLPFGAGPRACIGRGFAMAEAVTALAVILSRFVLRTVDDRDVELEAQVSLHPKGGLELSLSPR